MQPPSMNPCPTCLQFEDFVPSVSKDKLYLSAAQNLTVNCPGGTSATVPLPAGIIGYALTFDIGNPPYPNLVLNCVSGTISIPVPDNATQNDLDALINSMLNQCLAQIAVNIACASGAFFNTTQTFSACAGATTVTLSGALPNGVTLDSVNNVLTMAAGIIQSVISVSDANGKAQQVLREIFSTGNVTCV